jgi:predicted nucleic acid-binding protein
MFLLDTNVVSELRKAAAGRCDPAVAQWAEQQAPETLYLSVISVLELELGIAQLARRDTAQAKVLRRWVDIQVLPAFANRILPIDVAVARNAALLHVPDRRPERDALIAATAGVHQLTVMTRNVEDFVDASVPVLNPWLYKAPGRARTR